MVRTCVLSRTGGEASHVLTVSLTYVPPRTYRSTLHVRTYLRTYARTYTLTYRTYVPFHTRIVHTVPYAHLRTYRFTQGIVCLFNEFPVQLALAIT